jgi:hypothetical protein
VKLHAFTEGSQASQHSVKLVKLGESTQDSQVDAEYQPVNHR